MGTSVKGLETNCRPAIMGKLIFIKIAMPMTVKSWTPYRGRNATTEPINIAGTTRSFLNDHRYFRLFNLSLKNLRMGKRPRVCLRGIQRNNQRIRQSFLNLSLRCSRFSWTVSAGFSIINPKTEAALTLLANDSAILTNSFQIKETGITLCFVLSPLWCFFDKSLVADLLGSEGSGGTS